MHKSQSHLSQHRRVLPHERNTVFNVTNMPKLTSQQVSDSKKEMAKSAVPPSHFYRLMLEPRHIHRH